MQKTRQPRRFGVPRTLGFLLWASVLGVSLSPSPTRANPHDQGQSYILFEIYASTIRGEFQASLEDLNVALDLDLPIDGTATSDDLDSVAAVLQAYYQDRVAFSSDGRNLTVRYIGLDLLEEGFAQFAVLRFEFENLGAEVPADLDIKYDALFEVDSKHRCLVAIKYSWKDGVFEADNIALVLEPDARSKTLDLSSSSMFTGFLAIVKLGTFHIWGGIDHILFLMALIIPAVVRRRKRKWDPVEGFKPAFIYVLKIVTIFTLAHSVTLSLAALGVVQLPSRLVESIIAASIFAAALDILYPIFGGRIWLVVFGFGLFHGFGFAGALVQMGVTRDFAGLSLFGFNLGVEIGQVVIIAATFPLLFLMRKWRYYPRVVLGAGAILMCGISLLWLIERLFDVNVPVVAVARQLVGA